MLEETFHGCREEWIVDFLFKSDMSPLSILTSPVNVSFVSAAHVSTISAEKLSAPNCPSPTSYLFDMRMAGEFLFVPAFSVGSITAGFGVVHYSALCRAEWGRDPNNASRRNQYGHIRFVRDDAARSLIISFDDTDADMIKFDVFYDMSSAVRKRITLTLRRSKFYHTLRNQPVVDLVQAACPTALTLSYSIERRKCPSCSLTPHAFCTCRALMPVVLPKHSLDFSFMRNNMDIHGGAFEGVSTSSLFVDGVTVASVTVAHHLSIEGNNDRGITSRLGRWAVRDLLKNTTETPFKDSRLTFALIVKCLYASDDNGSDGSDTTDNCQEAQRGVHTREPHLTSYLNQAEPTAIGQWHGNRSRTCGPSAAFTEPQSDPPVRTMVYRSATNVYDCRGAATLPGDSLAMRPYGLPQSNGGRAHGGTTEATVAYASDDHTPPSLSVDMQNEGSGVAKRGRVHVGGVVGRDGMVGSGGGSLRSGSTVGEGLFAAGGNQFGHGDVGNVRDEEIRAQRDQAIKAELRRKRNREAAQRSNLRRKIRNDTLKHELVTSHARAKELRAREQLLREENLKLRKLLSSISA